MSDIEFSQLNTQNNTQETPIKMSSQTFTPSTAFLKAVEKEMKSYVTALSKAGALNCSVKVAMEALLSGREIEKPVKKVKAKKPKKPKMSDEEKAAKKEAALKIKEEKKAAKELAKAEKKAAALKIKEEKKAVKELEKAAKKEAALKLKEDKKAAKELEKAAKKEAALKLKEEKKAAKALEKTKLKEEKAAKKEAAKTLKSLKKVPMPFLTPNKDESVCKAIVKNSGLYTQCVKKSCSDDEDYCTKCLKDAECSPNSEPKYGVVANRIVGGFKEGTAPAGFEKSTGYVNYADLLVKKNISIEEAKAYAEASGLDFSSFPEEYLKCAPKKKRGRKPNTTAASDSDEETPKKKRGRPAKVARAVTPTAELLANQVDSDVEVEEQEDELECVKFEHYSMPGLNMAIDAENNVYNADLQELIGKYDKEADVINFVTSSDDESEELSEEDISDIEM